MLTTAAPTLVPLAPGRTAYVGINKNACVGREYHTAHLFQVIPPNDYQPLSLTTGHYPLVGYCPAGDPGHTVDVSPVASSMRGVMNLH